MKRTTLIVILLTALGLLLRVWRLGAVPPGLRVDELSNAYVVTQRVLDGRPAFFYAEASGHEGLWHLLQALFIWLFGRSAWGVRGVSVLLGTATIPLTYFAGRSLLNRQTGVLAAALMTVGFWPLMYARVGTRHISSLPFLLLAFALFWQGLQAVRRGDSRRLLLLSALPLGVGLYTYFAAWVGPAVIVSFAVVAGLLQRRRWPWRPIGLTVALALLLALPLLNDIRRIPEDSEGRVSEVAKPLHSLRAGDFGPLLEHVRGTLAMFHAGGDGEFLYNIPGRPLFGLPVALLFGVGVLLAAVQLVRRSGDGRLPYLFLLIWLVGGISPAFISVPPASLSHTLAAQPAVYLLLALPLGLLAERRPQARWGVAVAALLLVVAVAQRDLRDYFVEWPQMGMVRFLYHGEIESVADYLQQQPLEDFGISGTLAGPWERLALSEDGARWYDAQRALMLRLGGEPARNLHGYPYDSELFGERYQEETQVAGTRYRLGMVTADEAPSPLACFGNGLCLLGVDVGDGYVDVTWQVQRRLDLPPPALNSFPPAPGRSDSPRLASFVHLLQADGQISAGDDGLWVDPYTLQAGDRFVQRHFLDGDGVQLAIGLYDPLTGVRLVTATDEERILIGLTPK